ncbi:MAG: DNA polymerase III subunit [Acidobacteria bacterium]|nr:DNA polymerase III subunit [Acidobacteriota bacterium]
MFDNFHGNLGVVSTLERMIVQSRIPQTLLLAGREGVGKATLARRFAASLLGGAGQFERDDLSLEHNLAILAEREKWASEKRVDDPLLFASHSDFVTFAPDGPLRQISIQQMRLLKERAQFKPLRGAHRVFLIDRIDRANEQAANSLLKTLEEPPEHLIVFMTAENPYDLLPTIRSRSVPFQLAPLAPDQMAAFLRTRALNDSPRRLALAQGSPGLAVSLDLEAYDKRRASMLALLEAASRRTPFSAWVKHGESIAASKTEKLDFYLKLLYGLLEDMLALSVGAPREELRNSDVAPRLEALSAAVSFDWIRRASARVDELAALVRRNIQKGIALDALVLDLRRPAR